MNKCNTKKKKFKKRLPIIKFLAFSSYETYIIIQFENTCIS